MLKSFYGVQYESFKEQIIPFLMVSQKIEKSFVLLAFDTSFIFNTFFYFLPSKQTLTKMGYKASVMTSVNIMQVLSLGN